MSSLLSISVTSKTLQNASLLVYSKCIEKEYPEILKKFTKNRIPLPICMEEHHIDSIGFKLISIITLSNPYEIVILTMDGSPHCIQLHFLGEHINKILKDKGTINHYNIEYGKIIKIPQKTIKIARHLSQCLMLSNRSGE